RPGPLHRRPWAPGALGPALRGPLEGGRYHDREEPVRARRPHLRLDGGDPRPEDPAPRPEHRDLLVAPVHRRHGRSDLKETEMAVAGRKPTPEGQPKRNNHPTMEWTEVEETPFDGPWPDLPATYSEACGEPEKDERWTPATRRWFNVLK